MKNYILTIALFFLTQILLSAQCRYVRNEIDEFTKKTILETTKVVVKSRDVTGQALRFYGYRQNSSRFLKVNWNTLDITTVKSGDKLMIKLANNEILEVQSNDNYVSSPIGNYWTTTIYYYIDENTFQKLKENEIVKIRIYTVDGYVDKAISKGVSLNIIQLFKCIE